jgi:hypothetical protein
MTLDCPPKPTTPLDLPHGLDNRYLNNHEALAYLQRELDRLDDTTAKEYVIRLTRLHAVTKLLLDRFDSDGITITPRVNTNSAIIDLLVRMPDKRFFALMVRSSEDNSVTWDENRHQFFLIKKGRRTKASDSMTRCLSDLQTIVDLRKKKDPLVGATTKERNSPLIKAIVLAPGATISPKNPDTIHTTFGEAEVLKIQFGGTTYVVESEQLINFLLLPAK